MSQCFVIMPFGGEFDRLYTLVIRPAVEASGLSVVRADEIYSTNAIVDDIYRAITSAELCIADVSGRNPNVSYELGMAHASRKQVILLTQDIEDVPFDYRHLRLLKYDRKKLATDRALARRITRTIAELRRAPTQHIALPRVIGEREKLQQHTKNVFYAASYDMARTNWIYASEDGSALIRTSWRLTARSQVFHLCHNIVLDKPGSIDVLTVRDKIDARDLEWVIESRDAMHLSYFILLQQFKEPGQHFEIVTEVHAQHYFDFEALFRDGETMMSTQAVAGGIWYTRREDHLYLPKTRRFSRVHASFQSHPNESQIGRRIDSEIDGDNYALHMIYDAEVPFQLATAAFLRIH